MKSLIVLILMFPMLVIAETTNYSCNYTSYSDKDGNHKVKNKFELNFLVDRATGKSYMLGNNGSSEVTALEAKDQISFIELTTSRNVMTTAIDGELNSVHSRNSVMFGKMIPSQYYGKCVVK